MKCREAREKLAQRSVPAAPLAAHLAECRECAAFAVTLEALRDAAAGHHAGIEPDAGFSARVTARLGRRDDPVEALGWAAMRLLPAAAALAAALIVWALALPPAVGPEALLAGSTSDDAVVGLIISGGGDRP